MTLTKPLVLVDASSYLYRAFYAMPPLTNSQGLPTGAVYGVVNMIRKLLTEHDPEHIALIFDAKGRTFRDDLYAQYKAHRPRMPDDLSVQTAPLHAIIHAMGLPLLAIEGVEADDVIGTLSCQATELGMRVLIYTGDKDLAQLVNAQVTLINTMNNSVLDPQGVTEKFGVGAERIVDYLALVGDSVDNIPGVPKVGPTTAVKWLKQYGTLDNIIEHADEIGGKVGENLRAALAQLPVSRALLTVKCDVPLAVTPLDLQPRPANVEALRDIYKKLEFKAWMAQAPLKSSPAIATATSEIQVAKTAMATTLIHEVITTPAQHDAWLSRLMQAELVCFDLKTTNLDYMQAQIAGIAFALPGIAGDPITAYIPLAHDYENAPEQLERAQVLESLRPLLEDSKRAKLGHDIKFASHVLANHHIRLAGTCFDTMLESYLLDSTATRHDLDSLAHKYLDGRASTLEGIAGKGVRQLSFNQIAVEPASAHAAEQAVLILRLHEVLWPELSAIENLQRLFTHMEMPLVRVLARIERNGVSVDAQMLRAQSAELAICMDELEQQAYALAGQSFNLGSPLQIQEILYDKLGLPVLQKTPKGQPSTAEPVLQELALEYPLPKLILEHRAMSKLKSTYTDSLPEQINPATARVHTCYHQAVTATGRLSSSDPNLQNIPIRSAAGRRIRQAFIAAPGYQILAADYSQIELRIMAHLSGDTKLLRAFAAADDVHKITAAEVFGVAPEQVTPEQRRTAKTTNFALIYGMSSFGLARQLGIGRLAAQQYVNRYFLRYPGVKNYLDGSRAKARELGYVETILGRRLYVPQINDRNAQRRQYAERTAINAPLQGTAADIIKLAMLRVDAWINKSGIDAKMIMQVHDELVFEAAEVSLDIAEEAIRNCMIESPIMSIPLVVDIGTGNNWDEAH